MDLHLAFPNKISNDDRVIQQEKISTTKGNFIDRRNIPDTADSANEMLPPPFTGREVEIFLVSIEYYANTGIFALVFLGASCLIVRSTTLLSSKQETPREYLSCFLRFDSKLPEIFLAITLKLYKAVLVR